MPSPLPEILRHIDYSGRARPGQYTARGGGGAKFKVFQRARVEHARNLREEIQQIVTVAERLKASRELSEFTDDVGVSLEIKSEPGFPLKLEALDAPHYGVTLENVREVVAI